MTIDQIIPVAIQLPIVFLFIWYSDRKDKQFQEFLREEREARKEQTDATVRELTSLAKNVSEFRSEVNTAIKVMQDRTGRKD